MRLLNRFLMTYEALYAIAENLSSAEIIPEPGEVGDARAIAARIAQKMTSILDSCLYSGDPAEQKLLDEVRYLLAVLVDEMLLFQISWPGRDCWGDHLLEEKLFRTSVAGRRIFERINSLGNRHANPQDKEQLASIYLMLLQLGFHGECRYQYERIKEYQLGLNKLRSQPELPSEAFAQAYGHLLQGAYPHTHSTMSRWWRGVGMALGAYLILTLIFWFTAVYTFGRLYDNKVNHKVNAEKQASRVIGRKTPSFTVNNSPIALVEWQGVL